MMENHEFKLQAHEVKDLLEHGQTEIIHREKDKRLRLELTEDVETEKAETFKVTEK